MKRKLAELDASLKTLVAKYHEAYPPPEDCTPEADGTPAISPFEDAPDFYAPALPLVEPLEDDLRMLARLKTNDPEHIEATDRVMRAVRTHVAAAQALILNVPVCYRSNDALYQVVAELEQEARVLSSVAMWTRTGSMGAIRPRSCLSSYIAGQEDPIQ